VSSILMFFSCFAAVDVPSFYFQDQKDLYSSDMVQGPGILSCKSFFFAKITLLYSFPDYLFLSTRLPIMEILISVIFSKLVK